jgi:hypothetical protein
MSEPIRKTNARGIPVVSYDDGQTWDRDEERAQVATQEKQPVQTVPAATPSPVVTVPAPIQPTVTQPAVSRETEPSFWSKAHQALTGDRGALEVLEPEVKGVALGSTMGYAPKAAPILGAIAEGMEAIAPVDEPGLPARGYARGSLGAETEAAERSAYQQATEQHPVRTGIGYAAGSAPIFAAAAPYAAPVAGASRAANFAKAATGMGTIGAAQAAHTGDPAEIATSAGISAVAGPAAEAAGARAKDAAKWAAEVVGESADMWRASSVGAYGAQLKKLAQEKGPEYVRELGKAIERLGINRRDGGVLPSWVPQTAGSMESRASEVMGDLGKQIGSIVDEATAQGGGAPRSWVVNRLRAMAQKYEGPRGTAAVPSEGSKAAALRDAADRVAAGGKARMSNRELFDLKKKFESEAGFEGLKTPTEAATSQAYREAASVPREINLETIGRQVGPQARAALEELNKEFGYAKTAQLLSEGRYFQELGNQMVSLPGAGHGAAGASIGGVPGMAAGIAGWEVAKRFGRDVAADLLRAMEGAATRAGSAAEGAGRAASRTAQTAAGYESNRGPNAEAARILEILDNDPRAFGSASDAVREAAESGDTRRMNFLITSARNREARP